MFGKPRFRSGGPSATDMSSKASFNADREPGQETRAGEDIAPSGTFSVKNITSIESENSHALKRPISSQQKLSPQEKRNLKRTTSLIPRAAPPRSKTPSGEASKSARKSETSLKSKEVFVTNSIITKDKKFESIRTSRTTVMTPAEVEATLNKPKRPESQRNVVISAKGPDQPSRDPSRTRAVAKVQKKAVVERPEGRASHRSVSMSAADGNSILTKNLETQYGAKKTVYNLMIKEFKEKQKAIREQYRVLEDLRRKIQIQTRKEIPPEEPIKLQDLGPPFVVPLEPTKKNSELTCKRTIITFETKVLSDINVDFTEFCNSFESSLNQILDMWLNIEPAIMSNRKVLVKKIRELDPDLDIYELEKDDKNVKTVIEKTKYHTKVKADILTDTLKKLYANREKLKQELKTVMDSEMLSNIISQERKEMTERLKELHNELMKEKIRTEDLMDKRNMLEGTNLSNLEKIQKLEQIITEQQAQLQQLSYQCKNLKKKEVLANRGMSGVKAKDLKAKSELLKALETRITELTNEYNAEKKTLQARITELEQCITEKDEALKSEKDARQMLETLLADAEEKIKNVREKKKVFVDMVDKTKQILQATNSGSTKREEQLWMELEATKIVLKGYEDKINKMTDEKNKMLLKFQTVTEDKSNKNTERLAADTIRKEEIINNLKDHINHLQMACEEHNAKYNKLLAQVKEVHDKMDGKADVASLSKQLGEMKMQKKELEEMVKELVSHNEELETALVQRSLELDQRDRLVKQQCNLLKMRDELTELVRSKDDTQYEGVKKAMEQSTKWEKKAEKIFKDLEKKANELDDMYRILIDKQKQVEKLTKLVKIMEDQQDKAQEQRVRFETKISELQRQIVEGRPKTPKTPLFGN